MGPLFFLGVVGGGVVSTLLERIVGLGGILNSLVSDWVVSPSRLQSQRERLSSQHEAFLQERLLQFQRGGAEAEGPSQRSRGRSRCSLGHLGLLV